MKLTEIDKSLYFFKEAIGFFSTHVPIFKIERKQQMDDIKINVEGLNVVLTGTGPAPRNTLKNILTQYGANVQNQVTDQTNLLISENPFEETVKLKRAREKDITIKSYDEVFEIEEGEDIEVLKAFDLIFRGFAEKHKDHDITLDETDDGLVRGLFLGKDFPDELCIELQSKLTPK